MSDSADGWTLALERARLRLADALAHLDAWRRDGSLSDRQAAEAVHAAALALLNAIQADADNEARTLTATLRAANYRDN